MKEIIASSALVVWISVLVFALVICSTFGYLFFYKDILNLQREAVQHSNEYEQSKVTELVQTYDRYVYLDTQIALYQGHQTIIMSFKGQQAAAVKRMCQAYSLIPNDIRNDVVPLYIIQFLHDKGC
jgi:hypothetical protein